MERKITAKLLAWKNKKQGRRPLLISGARQVGKTYILREFGEKNYRNVAYINFEVNLAADAYFHDNIEPQRLLRFLETEVRERIIPGETLIIFDEIQYCERALTALKYFHEEAPEYHIACAGSLLGTANSQGVYSFPVGKVDSLTMLPCDFEEFLKALGEDRLIKNIKTSYRTNKALPGSLHERAVYLHKLYLIVGGMPWAITEYVLHGSLLAVADVQRKISNDYIADMSKYASKAENVKLRAAYNSIPVQLAKENRKFQYRLAQRGGTATLFGPAIEWLNYAGLVIKCGRILEGRMPLAVYSDLDSFKLYMNDVGLLTLKSGIAQQTVLAAGALENAFVNALNENYVAQALAVNYSGLYYWSSGGRAEVDFVLQKGKKISGVVIQNGRRTKTKSLTTFVQNYQPVNAVRVTHENFSFVNGVKNVPFYAVFCM